MEAKMRVPKKVLCEFTGVDGSFVCEIDERGYGRCGDHIIWDDDFCPWIKEILEWQEIEREVDSK